MLALPAELLQEAIARVREGGVWALAALSTAVAMAEAAEGTVDEALIQEATSKTLLIQAQKQVLLGMGLPFESWRADVPLGDFEGVSVGEDGLVVGLDFHGKEDVAFKLGDFALLVSLKELNMQGCSKATGGCVVWGGSSMIRRSGRGGENMRKNTCMCLQ